MVCYYYNNNIKCNTSFVILYPCEGTNVVFAVFPSYSLLLPDRKRIAQRKCVVYTYYSYGTCRPSYL